MLSIKNNVKKPLTGYAYAEASRVQIFLRAVCLLGVAIRCTAAVLFWAVKNGTRSRASCTAQGLARIIFSYFQVLNGVFPKIGQIASTRVDVLSLRARMVFTPFRSSCCPISLNKIKSFYSEELSRLTNSYNFRFIGSAPLGTGAVAQVHKARVYDNDFIVAAKFVKPDVAALWRTDIAIIKILCKVFSPLAWRYSVSLVEAGAKISSCLSRHLNLVDEAQVIKRVHLFFSESDLVNIPNVVFDISSEQILALEYIDGLRPIDSQEICPRAAVDAAKAALEVLFRLIFDLGIVHCDMHPGNILVDTKGRLVLLDFGGCAVLDDLVRKQFREFFYCMGTQDAAGAGKILLEIATVKKNAVGQIDPLCFYDDVKRLFDEIKGSKVAGFRVAQFAEKIFSIHRKNGLIAGANFVEIIHALFVFEGTALLLIPDVDFQEVARRVLICPLKKRVR